MSNTNKPWNQNEINHLLEGRTLNKPYELIGRELGRTAEACKSKIKSINWQSPSFDPTAIETNKFVAKSNFTGEVINKLDRRLKTFQVRADAISDVIEKSLERYTKAAPPLATKSKVASSSTEDMGLILSDLHVGAEHSFSDTGGLTEYNLDIFKQRMTNLQYAVKDIYNRHSAMYKIPKLHVFCIGDVVAGMNATGSWSAVYITSSIVDQVIKGFEKISEMIYYWLGLFEEIHFYGVSGNHSRSAAEGIQKEEDNWDYVCYKFLQTRFENNPAVKFHIPKSWWMYEKVRNSTFLLIHGDHLNGKNTKQLEDFYYKQSAIIGKNPDYMLAGHYHCASEFTVNKGKVLLNGSVLGADVYALQKVHAYSAPEQKLFGINDSHGITWKYDIDLTKQRTK
jgi:hypothetical protein